MGYDSASNMTTRQDQRGDVTSYSYDAMNRLLTEALPDNNPSNHPVVTFAYDAAGNQISVTDPLGNVVTTTFDKLNRAIAVTDALSHTTSYGFDGAGNQITMTDPLGRVATTTFDAANRQTATTDNLNHTTTLSLDADGRTSVSTDPLSQAVTYTYTGRSQVATRTDPLNDVYTYSYSATGNTTGTTYQAGSGGGSGGGHLMGIIAGPGQGHTFPGGPRPMDGGINDLNWTYGYDALGHKVTATDPLSHTITYSYDAAGRQVTITDRLGHVTTNTFDADDRLIATQDPLGHTVSYAFDAAGNKISMTDGLGRITTYNFDAQNREISQQDPRGALTSYGYDLAGRQIWIEDPVGNFTTYTFDAAGRTTQTADALGTATVAYDAAGQVTGTTDRDGRHISYSYDNAGRRTNEQWLDGSGNVTRTLTMTYNSDDWLASEQDPSSKYSFLYYGTGWLAVVDNSGTPSAPHLILTYSYDGFGNRSNLQDNFGGSVTYGYDAGNDLTSINMTVSGTQGPQVTMAYDAGMRMTGQTRFVTSSSGKITQALSYDNADRLTTIAYSSSQAGALATFTYGFDAGNQITSYNGPDGALTYTYDQSGEVTGVGGGRSESFSFDLNGNRNSSGYTTGPGNELTGDGTYTYAYDAEGNQTSKTRLSDHEQWTFTWDYRNRMTQAVEKPSAGVTVTTDQFTYDAEDRRIGNSVNGTQSWFGYDLKNAYIDFNGSGSVTMRYLMGLGLDQLYARFDGTTAAFYLTDNIRSVRLLVNASGTVLDQLTYWVYGGIQNETNSANGDRFKYSGREWNSELSLQFNRSRYYDPTAGRWTSQDPIRFQGHDANLYRYVSNKPPSANDPNGHYIMALAMALGLSPAGVIVVGGVFILVYVVAAVYLVEAGVGPITLAVNDLQARWQVTATTIFVDLDTILDYVLYYKEHTKGKRKSTKGQHDKGQARKGRDRGGEKKDDRMPYRRTDRKYY
jgi:RHS repeat-associated protein